MKILITGSTGLIGSFAIQVLTSSGHTTKSLRHTEAFDVADFSGVDAVIHLAGEPIAGRWTGDKKQRIRESRTSRTAALCEILEIASPRPKILVCASAIGFYGDRGAEVLNEQSPAGKGFLADVCEAWESAAQSATRVGIRVVNIRFGVVLSGKGGALAKMLLPFKLGAGGIIGDGRQYWSWISLADAVGIIQHALITPNLHGPVNAVSPNPVTNREFTKTLGKVLRRPTLLPMPAFAARLAFGEMADHLLLASARVEPKALKLSGYKFQFPSLEDALKHELSPSH